MFVRTAMNLRSSEGPSELFYLKSSRHCSLNFNKDGAGRQRQLMFDLKYRFDPFLASSV